jgi:hypothetical protein
MAVKSALRADRLRFVSEEDCCYSFLLEVSQTQNNSAAGKIESNGKNVMISSGFEPRASGF